MFVVVDYFRDKFDSIITMCKLLNYVFIEDSNDDRIRFDLKCKKQITIIFYLNLNERITSINTDVSNLVYSTDSFDIISVDNPNKDDVDKLIDDIKKCIVS